MFDIYSPVDKCMCIYYTIYMLWMCCIGSMDNIICDFVNFYILHMYISIYIALFVDSFIIYLGE